MEALLIRYRCPLLIWLQVHLRLSETDSEDMLHQFIAKRVIGSPFLNRADPKRGRFRSFLLTSLKNFVIQTWQQESRQKRRPANGTVPLDSQPEQTTELTPEFLFEAHWALTTLKEALRQTRDQCLSLGEPAVWEVLRVRLIESHSRSQTNTTYETLVKQFNFATPQHVSTALTTGQRRLKKHFAEQVAASSWTEADLDEELNYLREILENPAAWQTDFAGRIFEGL